MRQWHMTSLAYTLPDGSKRRDNRPGHTVVGMLYTLDPFQREAYVPMRRVTKELGK